MVEYFIQVILRYKGYMIVILVDRRNSFIRGNNGMSRKRKLVGTLILGLLLTSLPTIALSAEKNSIDRVYGENRYETMLQVALKLNPRTSDTIVLASGNNFPDALAGVPLAHQKNDPMLLVDSTPEESQEAFSYIKEHFEKQGTVYILGGDVVIPNTFVDQLVNLGVQKENIIRLGGWDQYETAITIAQHIEHKGNKFYVVSGDSFPDALSASVLAATADSTKNLQRPRRLMTSSEKIT